MEYINESGLHTGIIVSAEHKVYHDNAHGIIITMDIEGRYLKFILMIIRSDGSPMYSHKGENHLLPGLQVLIDITTVCDAKISVVGEDYSKLIGKNITVYIESNKHIIKRHEFYTNEVKRVVK